METSSEAPPVTYEDVDAARRLLQGVAHRTPVFTSRTLNRRVGAEVLCKGEHLQRTGAFKLRGAYTALSRLSPEEKASGVLTYSSGNHAQAVALAGRLLDVPATIIMPENAPEVKREATAGYGASIIPYNPEETTREHLAEKIARERGLPIIPPYDHPDIVAGQGTAAAELFEQAPELDALLVPCGGGGLLSGSALAASVLAPSCRVTGVEPAQADDATRSFHSGTLHTVHNPDTLADGARTPSLGTITFPLVRRYVDDMVTVSEGAILEALRFLWTHMKQVVEPTGALPIAALLSEAARFPERRVGVILSGGNADIGALTPLLFD